MKRTLFILTLLFSVTTIFSQTNLEVSLCGNTENTVEKEKTIVKTISQEALFECAELHINNADYTIKSFSVGMVTKSKDYVQINMEGNQFNERAIAAIKKHNPSKFYIEQIKFVSKEGTIQHAGAITIILKN